MGLKIFYQRNISRLWYIYTEQTLFKFYTVIDFIVCNSSFLHKVILTTKFELVSACGFVYLIRLALVKYLIDNTSYHIAS